MIRTKQLCAYIEEYETVFGKKSRFLNTDEVVNKFLEEQKIKRDELIDIKYVVHVIDDIPSTIAYVIYER